MSAFQEAHIALLEARMSSEMADLIRRYGGKPNCVPAVREAPLDRGEQVAAFIEQLSQASLRIVIFLTGVGVTSLFREAERMGRLPELLAALRGVTVICRGPKPVAVLKRNGIPIAITAPEPHTTRELLDAMIDLDVAGLRVGVVHYGERNVLLAQALYDRGAELEELCLYEWLLPEDVSPLQTLVQSIINKQVDAIVFTSQIQARHLFLIAEKLTLANELVQALKTSTVVASIGPTCTAVLQTFGVTPHVIPEHPKMGHLVKALAEYMK